MLAAEKGDERIAVEIKSFIGASDMQDLENALGQFILYRTVLAQRDPGRVLYLAIPEAAVKTVFDPPLGQLLLHNGIVRLIGFDPLTEEVVRWIF